jgi:RNA polymerase sigma-70 factor (ECF subfamily)
MPAADDASIRADLAANHLAGFGWALVCCGRRRAEAEDVLSLAYDKVLSGAARFDGRSSFKTWLFAVIRRTANEQRRRRLLHAALALRFLEPPEPPVMPDDESDARDRTRALVAALVQLPTRQREVLHLVFYEGMTVREAADAMGVATGTASLHYDRGKSRLLELLREKGTNV